MKDDNTARMCCSIGLKGHTAWKVNLKKEDHPTEYRALPVQFQYARGVQRSGTCCFQKGFPMIAHHGTRTSTQVAERQPIECNLLVVWQLLHGNPRGQCSHTTPLWLVSGQTAFSNANGAPCCFAGSSQFVPFVKEDLCSQRTVSSRSCPHQEPRDIVEKPDAINTIGMEIQKTPSGSIIHQGDASARRPVHTETLFFHIY